MHGIQEKTGWESRFMWDVDIVGSGGGVMLGEVGKAEGLQCHLGFEWLGLERLEGGEPGLSCP